MNLCFIWTNFYKQLQMNQVFLYQSTLQVKLVKQLENNQTLLLIRL